MALENKYGYAVVAKPGVVLETIDGKTITMVGNEVARLDTLLQQGLHS